MPLLEHLVELRRRLLWSAIAFVLAFAVCYHFSQAIYLFLAQPLAQIMRQKGEQPHLIYTALYEAFFTYIKVAFFGATLPRLPGGGEPGLDVRRPRPLPQREARLRCRS